MSLNLNPQHEKYIYDAIELIKSDANREYSNNNISISYTLDELKNAIEDDNASATKIAFNRLLKHNLYHLDSAEWIDYIQQHLSPYISSGGKKQKKTSKKKSNRKISKKKSNRKISKKKSNRKTSKKKSNRKTSKRRSKIVFRH